MIAIDLVGTTINSGTKTYNENFLNQLNRELLKDKVLVFVSKSYLVNEKKKLNNSVRYVVKPDMLSNSFIRLLWMQFILPFELKYYGAKIFFSPMNYAPILLKLTKIKSILAIHTVLPWLYLNFLPGNLFKNFLIKKIMELSIFFADKIIVPSNYAKQIIIEKLKIQESKIKIIYLGANHLLEKSSDNSIIKDFDYDKKYFLSVLSCVKYHNILNLFKGFKKFKEDTNADVKFVVVLNILDKNYFKIINLFVKKNFKNQEVEILFNLDNKYLRNLYKKSLFYIFTSYSEVFGFTTLEALSFNIPILVSDTSALKEINGNTAEYFDPDNIIDIKEKLIKFYLKPKKTNFTEHLKNFLWKENFQKTLDLINKNYSK